jgi:hypothetical protein
VEDAQSCCRDANTRVGEPREITSKKASDLRSSWKEGRKEDEQQHKKTDATKCTTRVGPGFGRRKKATPKPPSNFIFLNIKKELGGGEGRGVGFSPKLDIF